MTTDDPITRRGVLAGAAATAALAATRAPAQRGRERRPHEALDRRSEPPHRSGRPLAGRAHAAYLDRIETRRRTSELLYYGARREALAQARALRGRARARPTPRPAARHSDRPQGQHRHGGNSDDGRERRVRGPHPKRGRRVRAQIARGGGDVSRQAEHARVRVRRHVGRHALRARAQSMGSRLQPRRLVGWLGGRGSGAALRCRARHRHGGVGPLPGGVLRRRGAQSDARAREHSRHRAAVGVPRSRRAARAQRRRLRARDDGARGLRSARSREHPRGARRPITPRSAATCAACASAFRARRSSSSSIPEIDAAVEPGARRARRSHGPDARRARSPRPTPTRCSTPRRTRITRRCSPTPRSARCTSR